MQIIKSIRILALFLIPLTTFSQSSYIPIGSKHEQLLQRLEIKTGNANLMYSTIKPYNRRLATREVENIDSLLAAGDPSTKYITDIDRHNMESFLMDNSEWSKPREAYNSKKPFLKNFY